MSEVSLSVSSAGLLTISGVLLAFIYTVWSRNGSTKNSKGLKVPPGFPALPLVGSLPFMTSLENMPVFFMEATKKYGQVYTLYAGGKYTLVVNGYEALREALVKRSVDFAGRTQFYTDRVILNKKRQGILFRDYEEKLKQNRFHSLNIMKHLGFGDRHVMADLIQEEFSRSVDIIKAEKGKPMEVDILCHMTSVNIIHSLILSKRFDKDDPMMVFLMDMMIQIVDSYDPILDMFPLCSYLPRWSNTIKALVAPAKRLMEYYSEIIKESLSKPTTNPENFTQMYKDITGDTYDEEELKYIIRDLVLAGSETMGIQMVWTILLLCNHPEIQQKVFDEINSVIGRDRTPTMHDKPHLPYLEATMLEIMRIKPVAPLGAAHMTTCATKLSGFDIPANTMVVINLLSAHMDPVVWPEPEKFRPENFLDSNGEVINRNQMITFSLGKRACLGEDLARQEMFIGMATLVQKFQMLPPEGIDKLPEKMKTIRVIRPMPFKVRMIPRD